MPVNARPTVVCRYPLEQSVVDYGKTLFDFVPHDDPRAAEWKTNADAIMLRTIVVSPKEVTEIGERLKYVGKHGVGTNTIAVKELAERGIMTMNSAGVNAGAVSELALTLIMALARNVAAIDRKIRSGALVDKASEGAVGMQLGGRAFGIIGGGNIGLALARMLCGAFNAVIYLYDPFLSPEGLQRWADLVPSARFHRVERVQDMLPHIDVLSLHVPLLASTRDLVGEPELRMMQKHALLINTARGGVVNEQALLKALEEGWIAGAGIDAYEKEPFSRDDYPGLIAHERVISTPHIGAATLDVIRETGRFLLDQLADALAGNPPRNVVSA